jgi:hypothetical protein
MDLSQFAAKTSKLIADNSPTILTVIGVAGTVTTAVLTGKAAYRAAGLVYDEESKKTEEGAYVHPARLNRQEKFLLVWKLYVPAATSAALTVAAIVGANRINMRRAAVMAALYSASNDRLAEYKEKVVKHFGEGKEQKVRDEIAQDKVTKNPSGELVIIGSGQVVCYDIPSGRYFMSSMEEIRQAENSLNSQCIKYGYASLTDFYDRIGLPRNKFSEDVGWKSDQLLEIKFSTTMADNDKPALAIDYFTEPIRDFERAH